MRKTEETCSKYVGPVKFNGIPREGKPEISIQYYKDQCRKHMIRNGMWGVFSITKPQNKEKEWYLLLHHSKFPLEYVKGLVQSLLKGSVQGLHVFQGKFRMVEKKIPLLLFVLWFCNVEDILHPISDHMLTALILVGLDGYFWLSFSRNPIKIDRACIL